jgi:hypothetical protein
MKQSNLTSVVELTGYRVTLAASRIAGHPGAVPRLRK